MGYEDRTTQVLPNPPPVSALKLNAPAPRTPRPPTASPRLSSPRLRPLEQPATPRTPSPRCGMSATTPRADTPLDAHGASAGASAGAASNLQQTSTVSHNGTFSSLYSGSCSMSCSSGTPRAGTARARRTAASISVGGVVLSPGTAQFSHEFALENARRAQRKGSLTFALKEAGHDSLHEASHTLLVRQASSHSADLNGSSGIDGSSGEGERARAATAPNLDGRGGGGGGGEGGGGGGGGGEGGGGGDGFHQHQSAEEEGSSNLQSNLGFADSTSYTDAMAAAARAVAINRPGRAWTAEAGTRPRHPTGFAAAAPASFGSSPRKGPSAPPWSRSKEGWSPSSSALPPSSSPRRHPFDTARTIVTQRLKGVDPPLPGK